MALETKVVRATTPTTSGTVDLTSAGFGTPVAAILYMVYRGSDDTPNEADYLGSIGFTDGTNSRCVAFESRDALSTSVVQRSQTTDLLGQLFGGSHVKYASFNSWITDGLRVNWTIVSGTAPFEIIAILIKGVSAAVGTVTPNGSVAGTVSVTSLGFDPAAVMFLGQGVAAGFNSHNVLSVGMALSDGTQRAAAFVEASGASTVDVQQWLSTNRIGGQVFSGSVNWSAEATAWPTGGFTLTTRDGATAGDTLQYLAITDGGSNLSLQTIASPTSTGTQDYTVSGTPHTAIGWMGRTSATDVVQASGNDSAGIFAAESGSGEYSASWGDDDGAATTATWNLFATKLIDIRSPGSPPAAFLQASVNAWSSNTLQFNWTAVDASTRYGWVLIASDAGGASSGDITDAFLVSDTHLATATTPAVTSDSSLVSDTQAALATVAAATSDSILAADTQASTAAAAAITIDAGLAEDTQVATAAAAVTIADSGLISDTQDGAIGASTSSATTADAALMSDSFSATATVPATTIDAILVSDNQVATAVASAAITDAALVSDTIVGAELLVGDADVFYQVRGAPAVAMLRGAPTTWTLLGSPAYYRLRGDR